MSGARCRAVCVDARCAGHGCSRCAEVGGTIVAAGNGGSASARVSARQDRAAARFRRRFCAARSVSSRATTTCSISARRFGATRPPRPASFRLRSAGSSARTTLRIVVFDAPTIADRATFDEAEPASRRNRLRDRERRRDADATRAHRLASGIAPDASTASALRRTTPSRSRHRARDGAPTRDAA